VTTPSERWPFAVFALCVAGHALLLLLLAYPFPQGKYADEHVYLEMADNLWHEHAYGSRVSGSYPPGYPMLIAPAFAIDRNAPRYTAIRVVHVGVFAAASLTLLPAFGHWFGRRRRWLLLGGLQLLGGVVHYGKTTQTEPLFTALLVAVLGLAWSAWHRPSAGRWVAVGAMCGLAVATRRTALVLPVSFALLAAVDVVGGWRKGRSPNPTSALGWLVGFAVGLVPEMIAMGMSEGAIDPYKGKTAGSHLQAGTAAFESRANLWLATQTTARHLAWLAWSTAGAPLLLVGALCRRDRPPRADARSAALVLLVGLGLTAMTVLHMIRYRFGRPEVEGWDLYPRYVDPVEPLLVAAALIICGWLIREGVRFGAGRALALGAAGWALLAVAGKFERTRGGRLPRLELRAELPLPDALVPWLFLLVGAVVLGGWTLLAARDRLRVGHVLLGAIAISWLVSAHHPWLRVTDPKELDPPPVLELHALVQSPSAPLAVVVVQETGWQRRKYKRRYYAPAFKSDHRVHFIKRGEELAWVREHPTGFVITLARDPQPRTLHRRGRGGRWIVWEAPLEEPDEPDEPDG